VGTGTMARFIKDAASAAATSPISPSPAISGGVKVGSRLMLLVVVVADNLPASTGLDGNGKNVLVVWGKRNASDNEIWWIRERLKTIASNISCFIRGIDCGCSNIAFIVWLALKCIVMC